MNKSAYCTIKKKIGKKIKHLRAARGLTIEKLAFENDLAKGTLS